MIFAAKNGIDAQVRWMIRRDLTSVLDIERQGFEFPWTEEDFLSCLRQRNCIGTVAEIKKEIVGFMVYELTKQKINILNFGVSRSYRRQSVGTSMIDRLKAKLSPETRNMITLDVRESNLDAQLFFKANGFEAFNVLRGNYDDTDEDAYQFCYTLPLV